MSALARKALITAVLFAFLFAPAEQSGRITAHDGATMAAAMLAPAASHVSVPTRIAAPRAHETSDTTKVRRLLLGVAAVLGGLLLQSLVRTLAIRRHTTSTLVRRPATLVRGPPRLLNV